MATTMYFLLVTILCWNQARVVNGECSSEEYDLEGVRCCTRCAPGSGIMTKCSMENNTVCEQCIEGMTFSAWTSHEEACSPCSPCAKNAHVVQVCNTTHDTVCECDQDFYLSEKSQECVLCDLCPAGWGAQQPCTVWQNAVCVNCPNGTYSRELSATAGCIPCSQCTDKQQMLQACSSTQDTICINIPVYKYDDDLFMDEEDEHPVQTKPARQDKEIDIIPLYCAILGAVVVGLLGYVILVHYRRMREKRLIREPHDDVEYSKASGGDSGIYVEVEHHPKNAGTHCAMYTCATRVRELPSSKKKEIERLFVVTESEASDWKSLAQELGYNNRRIAGFEVRAQRDSNFPLRHLLHEWGKSENATVGALVRALKNIDRHDVIRVLQTSGSELQPLNTPQSQV